MASSRHCLPVAGQLVAAWHARNGASIVLAREADIRSRRTAVKCVKLHAEAKALENVAAERRGP